MGEGGCTEASIDHWWGNVRQSVCTTHTVNTILSLCTDIGSQQFLIRSALEDCRHDWAHSLPYRSKSLYLATPHRNSAQKVNVSGGQCAAVQRDHLALSVSVAK